VKTLLLLRHAKSNWDNPSLRDFDRPLAGRGKRDAPRVGRALKESGPAPDLIVSSPAARARETVEAVIKSAGFTAPLRFDESIYDASVAELMRVIRGLPDDSSCVLMVGHNPGFEGLVYRLAGASERMTTAALATIEFQVDRWADVEDGRGRLLRLLTPGQLPGEAAE
jgi:phosphohistidine phosphatase